MANAIHCPNGHDWNAATGHCSVCGVLPADATEPVTVPSRIVAPDPTDAQGASAEPGEAPTIAQSSATASVSAPPAGIMPGYALLRELGRGGMGVVYEARQVSLGRVVALKMILAGGHAGQAALARFRTEAEAIARLQHPHIVQIHEIGEHDGLPFFSLEYCSGGSLAQKLSGTPMQPMDAAALIEPLARAMHAAHSKGVIHRDLKPANVLLVPLAAGESVGVKGLGVPKITDFGLAKKLDEAGHTGTGDVMGTPSYMAPEQAGGRLAEIGPACDTYALGAMLYECMTGRPPFRAATPLDTVLQVVTDEAVPVRRLNSLVPRDLETICHKCLHKEPAKRYATAAALADDLARFQRGEPIAARPVGHLERLMKWARRRPAAAALTAVSAAAIVAVVGGSLVFTALLADERDKARLLAEQETRARTKADDQLARAELALYAGQLARANLEWDNNDVDVARYVLSQCPLRLRGPEFRYLYTRFNHRGQQLLTGHASLVTCVAYGPDGKRLASADRNGIVRLWDMDKRTAIRDVNAHAEQVNWVCFSADGKRLASASDDATVKIWDSDTGAHVLTILGHKGRVPAVAFSPNGRLLASGGADRTIRLWDAEDGHPIAELPAHKGIVFAVDFNPDGTRLASASLDRTVKLWDTATQKLIHTLAGHTKLVMSVRFSRDGKRLASGSEDRTVKVWDAADGREVITLRGHTSFVTRVTFSPDGRRLASGSEDHTIKVWELGTGRVLHTIRGVRGWITGLCYDQDGKCLASANGADGTVGLWDPENGQDARSLPGPHFRFGNGVFFSPDSTRLATTDGFFLRVWDPRNGAPIFSRKMPQDPERPRVRFSHDGKHIAVARNNGSIELLDAATGNTVRTLAKKGAVVHDLRFSSDRKHLISAGSQVVTWEWETGRELRSFELAKVWQLAVSPDGSRVAMIDAESKSAQMVDVTTQARGPTIVGLAQFGGVCFSADGRRLALAEAGGPIQVRDAADGRLIATLTGHTGWAHGMSFSADGTRLASAGADNTVKIWDVESGQDLLTLRGHKANAVAVALSPDGNYIASADVEGNIRIWDTDRSP
jgi:WD40 repeat protein